MNTPAYAEATLSNLATAKNGTEAAVATRPDALFLVNNLGIGGSERKIVRLANRLKDEERAIHHRGRAAPRRQLPEARSQGQVLAGRDVAPAADHGA